MLPEPFRIWETTRMGLAAWAVAATIGYVLCARPTHLLSAMMHVPASHRHLESRAPRTAMRLLIAFPRGLIVETEAAVSATCVCWRCADIRPKMYPKIEYDRARAFTPKEVEEWNQASTKKR
jgi:hypothetical protein